MFSETVFVEFELGPLRLMQDSGIGKTNKLARQRIVPLELLVAFQPRIQFTFAAIGIKPLLSINLWGVSIDTVAHWKSSLVGIQVRHLIRSGPPGR